VAARRNHGPNKKRLYAASKIPPANDKWPALRHISISTSFPRPRLQNTLIKSARNFASNPSTCSSSMSGTTVGPTIPNFAPRLKKLKRWRMDSLLRPQSQSLEPEKRHQGSAHRISRRGAGDLHIFDQAPEDKLVSLCQELNIGVIRARPSRRRQPRGKMNARNPLPQRRLARALLWAGKSGEHDSPRRQAQEDRARRHDAAGNVPALHPVPSRSQHDYRRHARPGARTPERCRQLTPARSTPACSPN